MKRYKVSFTQKKKSDIFIPKRLIEQLAIMVWVQKETLPNHFGK